ncbi:hypothetical protein DIS24_g10076 [Lasiodiplodia hormozganensis]|uniref:Uncharacterized protein n=1 Tax=Lasiodiplodia hormozganensis TaxID=869390 RepID=A0AA40CGP9_9PEZI|nr:hypothetical protein DIS24_g10076 [Lasiodiplodia hormozganensis]
MDATSDSKHPRASFDIVDELGRPIEQVDLTGAVKDNSEKKEKPAIEFGAVTFASSTLLLAQNQPEKKMTATTTTPDTMKADSRMLTPTPNSNSHHLTSSQQTNKSGERVPTQSHPVQRSNPPPSSSKLKRLGPLTNDESKDDDGYIDIDAPPPPKKPRLFPSPQTTTTAPSNPTPYPVTTTTAADPSPASLQRSLAAATDQIKRERERRRKAERRAAEYAQHGAPVMRTAARLARWVVDMYAEHRQQQLGGGRRDDEIEAFLGEIRSDVGTKAWGRLLWLGAFLRDNLDGGEEGGEGGGGGAKSGAAKLEKEMNKEAVGGDGATDGGKVAEVGASGGGAVAKGTTRLEDEGLTKGSVSL